VRSRSKGFIGIDEEAGLQNPCPTHASTMPPRSAGTNGPATIPRTEEQSHDSTIVTDDPGNDNHPRKRKKGFLARFGKKGKDDGKVQGTTTSESKKSKQKFTFAGQLKATLLNSWINVLLIAVPVGIILNYLHIKPVIIFVVNFIAIIPLAAMLSYATEEIALRTGETIGGLLNASFGSVLSHSNMILDFADNIRQKRRGAHCLDSCSSQE